MSTQDEDELRRQIGVYTEAVFMHSISLGHGKTHQEATDAIMELVLAREQSIKEQAEDKGFKEGQRVGQYQAADRLYSHVTTMWLFKDDLQDPKLQMPERADNLLKDCEKYLNHTRKVYTDYLRSDRYRRLHSTYNSLEEK